MRLHRPSGSMGHPKAGAASFISEILRSVLEMHMNMSGASWENQGASQSKYGQFIDLHLFTREYSSFLFILRFCYLFLSLFF